MSHVTIKGLPVSERPYEKCMQRGASSLSDAELLAVILKSGTRRYNSVEVARKILMLCGEEGRLGNLRGLTSAQLMQIEGIGQVKAIQIQCLAELCSRMSEYAVRDRALLNSPEKIAQYYMEPFSRLEQEEMHLVFLDTKNHWIQEVLLTKGTVNASLVSTRELFIEALRNCAVHVVMIHNHPSGDPSPSAEDIAVTRKVKEAGELLDILLLDHIIIGNNRYFSMKAAGYL
ncbi:MAG: DNA repair protein RadC [Lachnospiraceae bacterium]|nr:DNA repair protein RadC [Lachnospiraceae bacterium]